MKKIFSTLCMALVAVAMMAQAPVITFEKTEHDFGKIQEEGGRVSVDFEFKNEGMSPLVLSNVRASCGCTTPKWTKEPVEPGQTGVITVTYNPNGRPGRFQKTVTITSNATEATKKVYIKGEVLPKQAKPVNKYTIAVGALSMKAKTIDLGTIKKGETKVAELEIANLTQEDHNVDIAISPADTYLDGQVSLPTMKANEVGKLTFSLDSKVSPRLYGPVVLHPYVVVDGKLNKTEEFQLTIKADIEEDFSQLTVEQKQQAPIIELPAEIDLGKVAAGKVLKGTLNFKNTGVNVLEIRRLYCEDEKVVLKGGKATRSGKKGSVTIEINTKDMKPGAYNRQILVISNDYEHSKMKVKLNFTIE